jgi:peptidoglycan/LPS O-acetylase OafA/YrhL
MQFFFGAFLSDLSQHPPHIAWCQSKKWLSRILSPILIVIGLLLASYPEDKAQWMTWSRYMGHTSIYIFPKDNETPRYYSGIGLEFIALGIHFSPSAKKVLSSKYLLWFGKNSFAVYLLHGALLRSVLVWMLFGFSVPPDIIKEDGRHEPAPKMKFTASRARWYFWLPIWFVMLYYIANLWTKYVDPWCARVTERFVKYVFEDPAEQQGHGKEDQEKRLLPQ